MTEETKPLTFLERVGAISAPTWSSEARASIDVQLDGVPFHVMPNDPESHGRELWAKLVAGDYGPIADPLPRPVALPGAPAL